MTFPADTDAEFGLVGAVIEAGGLGSATLEPSLFTNDEAAGLAEAVRALAAEPAPVLAETVARRARNAPGVGRAIERSAPGAAYWLGILRERRALRAMQATAQGLLAGVERLAPQRQVITDDIVGLVTESVASLRDAGAQLAGPEPRGMKDHLRAVVERMEAADRGVPPPCVSTGIWGLDNLLDGGLQDHFMITLGARSGVGKSAIACWFAATACKAGHPVLYGSRELPAEVVTHRLLCLHSGVSFRMSEGSKGLPESDRWALVQAQREIRDWPLELRDDLASIEGLVSAASLLRPRLLIVDHVGIFGVGGLRKAAGPFEEVTRKSNLLRDFAKDTGVPTVTLAQLNRQAVDAERPMLSHLKQSGALEEDSRVVMLLWRQEEDTSPGVDLLRLDVAKNTTGRCGEIALRFHKPTSRFFEVRERPD